MGCRLFNLVTGCSSPCNSQVTVSALAHLTKNWRCHRILPPKCEDRMVPYVIMYVHRSFNIIKLYICIYIYIHAHIHTHSPYSEIKNKHKSPLPGTDCQVVIPSSPREAPIHEQSNITITCRARSMVLSCPLERNICFRLPLSHLDGHWLTMATKMVTGQLVNQ